MALFGNQREERSCREHALVLDHGSPYREFAQSAKPTDSLPAKRGRMLVLVGEPIIETATPRFCHFSWRNKAFCLRDFIGGSMRCARGTTSGPHLDVWKASSVRVSATGKFFIPVEDTDFWTDALKALTETHQPR